MKKYISIITIIFLIFGCTSGFEELQKNPNLPEEVNPGLLLPSIIHPAVNAHVTGSREICHELMQYSASNNSFTQVQRFIFTLGNSNSVWNGFYGRMKDIYMMEDLAKDLAATNYEAIALVLKSWSFSILTDVFNDIPYSEAGMAIKDENFTPKYDSQKSIYQGIIADLKSANDMFDTNTGLSFGGDVLYNDDIMKWKKFANSLRLRLLMRVSYKSEINFEEQIREIVDNPDKYPLFESNDDHAVYYYSGILPDVFPYSTSREFDFNNFVASEFIVEKLKSLNDPRLSIFFEPTKNSVLAGEPQYVGLPSGIPAGDSFEFNGGRDGQSLLNNSLFLNDPDQPGIIMSYAEVQFLLAEAALRNIIDLDPRQFYENGVKAAMDYWGAEMPTDYLTVGSAVWDGKPETLFMQKYLSLFWAGFESWIDHRRTGYPAIVPGPANVNDNKIPVRLTYPTIEQSLNGDNYTEATARIGGDNINSKGWWETF